MPIVLHDKTLPNDSQRINLIPVPVTEIRDIVINLTERRSTYITDLTESDFAT